MLHAVKGFHPPCDFASFCEKVKEATKTAWNTVTDLHAKGHIDFLESNGAIAQLPALPHRLRTSSIRLELEYSKPDFGQMLMHI